MKMPMEFFTILVIVNSIGIVPIITFFVKIWYKSLRQGELIKHLLDFKKGAELKIEAMEKDLLKESFKIVNKLKKKLENHFKLNYV